MDGQNKWAGGLIGMSVVGLLWFLAWALVFHSVPTDNREPLLMLIGVVSNAASLVVGFHYGSSQSSRTKDSAIEKQADAIQTAQAALTPAEPAIPVGPGEKVTVKGEEA